VRFARKRSGAGTRDLPEGLATQLPCKSRVSPTVVEREAPPSSFPSSFGASWDKLTVDNLRVRFLRWGGGLGAALVAIGLLMGGCAVAVVGGEVVNGFRKYSYDQPGTPRDRATAVAWPIPGSSSVHLYCFSGETRSAPVNCDVELFISPAVRSRPDNWWTFGSGLMG
jgi:hypothetical protein